MTPFFTLVLAHLIADFPLQTNRIYAMKLKSSRGIAFHVLIHVAITALLIKEPLSHLPLFIILASTHFLIDWLKLRYPIQHHVAGFLLDQAAHFTVLGFLAVVSTTVLPVLPVWLLVVALIYAFVPPIIMFLWLLAIDKNPVKKHKFGRVKWCQRNLLPISHHAGLPLLVGVALRILFL